MSYKHKYINGKRVYTVYKVVSPSNKVYIGFTSRKLKYRIKEHLYNDVGSPFSNAMQKYKNEMKFEVIGVYFVEKYALKMEQINIKKYESLITQKGYNSTYGGEEANPVIFSKKTRKTLSENAKKMWENNREVLIEKLKVANKDNRVCRKGIVKSAKKRSVSVIDNNGEIYNSITIAAEKNNTSHCSICASLKNGWKASDGRKYTYYNDGNYEFIKTRKVKCLDNDKIYNTAVEASKELELKNAISISRVCRGERNSYKGYRFKYVFTE